MFDQSFSYILAIAALVIGIMILTGHGKSFRNRSDSDWNRNRN